jgi:predicted ATP-grasp superfamily ATP-dependent carboligase
MGHVSRWASEVVDCPHPENDPVAFAGLLLDLAARYPGAMLVPSSDVALTAVVGYADVLARAGYVVAAPSSRAVATCLNKAETYVSAERAGVPAPATLRVGGMHDLERFAARAEFPAVLKPELSHRYQAVFGRKWTRVDDLDHAVREYQLAEEAGLEVIIQELIPGEEHCGANYNAYRWGSEALVEMTAEKVRNSPAEAGSPSVVVSRDLPDARDTGRRMMQALDYHGFANIELKRDPRDGLYKIIEINARHNLSAQLAYHCGIDFPWLQYRHLMYGERPTSNGFTQGVYWIDGTRDLRAAPSYLRRGGYSLRRFLRPYLAPHVSAVWAADDMRPARARAWDTLRSLAGLLARSAPAARPVIAEGVSGDVPIQRAAVDERRSGNRRR